MKRKLVKSINYLKRSILQMAFLLLIFTEFSCSVSQTVANPSRLEFKINSTQNFQLAGVSLREKNSMSDFSSLESLKLSTTFIRNSFPLTFTVNIDAKNPNDGTIATIVSFPWRLFIDDKQTITGDIGSDVTVPSSDETTIIPVHVTIDLIQFYKDKGYEGMIKFALNLAREGTIPLKISLYAMPTVNTSLGNIKYPDEIRIVNFEYSK